MRRLLLLLALSLCALGAQAGRQPPAIAVASAHPMATQAGIEILEAGGNAFDAAVAVSAVLAVVEPYSSGLGGGGFWLLHEARCGRDIMLDGRERAPLAATRDMYLDADGEVRDGASMDGPLAAGIPGQPAALVHIAEDYGRLPLSETLAPAIAAARTGFVVTPHYREMAAWRRDALRASPAAAATFLLDGEVPPLGHTIRQPELAATLQRLADAGRDGFYTGEVAEALVAGVRAGGGIWSLGDLSQYQAVEREPVRGRFGDFELVSAAPPSSGGVALAQMLGLLDTDTFRKAQGAERVHWLTEAMRRAYRDRAEFLGDPDFVAVPVYELTHADYLQGLRSTIDPTKATPSSALAPATPPPQGNHTTHFSILDGEGNFVAATLSINYPFGAGWVVPGTGILLNDEMDDFSAKPGVPNAYGLVGAEANAIAPGKRMLSSMSPTFVYGPDGVAILGTPGGSRIITMVLQGVLAYAEGAPVEAWVSRPRLHHQYLPDTLFYEPGALDAATRERLGAMGHTLKEGAPWGNMQAIAWDWERPAVSAASDPRVEGAALVVPRD